MTEKNRSIDQSFVAMAILPDVARAVEERYVGSGPELYVRETLGRVLADRNQALHGVWEDAGSRHV